MGHARRRHPRPPQPPRSRRSPSPGACTCRAAACRRARRRRARACPARARPPARRTPGPRRSCRPGCLRPFGLRLEPAGRVARGKRGKVGLAQAPPHGLPSARFWGTWGGTGVRSARAKRSRTARANEPPRSAATTTSVMRTLVRTSLLDGHAMPGPPMSSWAEAVEIKVVRVAARIFS